MKPASNDYEFFYDILKHYQKFYGKDKKISELPEFYLDPRDTIQEATNKMRKHINLLLKYVIIDMAVQTAIVTVGGNEILEILGSDLMMTFGRVTSWNENDENCVVQYKTQTGKLLDIMVPVKDIIAFGQDAIDYIDDTWNGNMYEELKNV